MKFIIEGGQSGWPHIHLAFILSDHRTDAKFANIFPLESEIHLRIHSNDGGGYFSQEWVAWVDIQKALDKVPKDQPITSIILT